MIEQEELPPEWTLLERDDRDSTVAYFVGGYERKDGIEILIWHGVEEEDGTVVIETSSDNYDEGRHTHIIEGKFKGEVRQELFTESEEEAWEVADEYIERVSSYSSDD